MCYTLLKICHNDKKRIFLSFEKLLKQNEMNQKILLINCISMKIHKFETWKKNLNLLSKFVKKQKE